MESLIDSLGYPSEAVDVLLFAHDLIFPEPQDEPASPVALSPEERRVIDRAVMAAGWTAGNVTTGEIRGELIHRRRQEKVEGAKQEAEELLKGLMAASCEERAALVEVFPDYWNWALAVRLCEQSVKRRTHPDAEASRWWVLSNRLSDSPGLGRHGGSRGAEDPLKLKVGRQASFRLFPSTPS